MPIVSESFSLGACSGDPITQQRCTFVWEVPGLALPRLWGFEGTSLWRRSDGLMYGFGEWSMARRRGGGLYEASESEGSSDWEGLYGGGESEDGEEEGADTDDSMASFLDDDLDDGFDDESVASIDASDNEGGAEGEETGQEGEGEEEGDDEEEEDSVGLSSPDASDAEEAEGGVVEGGVVRASCLLEGDWEPRALLRIECLSGRTPTVELSFELQGDRVIRWAKVRRILEDLRWG